MKQLSGMDSLFLTMENSHQHMHVGGLGIYDPSTAPGGMVRFKSILDFFENRINQSKILRRRLVVPPMSIDRPYWIEIPKLDVEYHIRHIALPKPGDWRQLCIQVARIHARPLDLSMPAWECYVIEGLDNIAGIPPGSFALFIKLHHAAVDGEAATELMKAIHTLNATGAAGLTNEAIIADREPSSLELYTRAVINRVGVLVDASKLMLDLGKLSLDLGKRYIVDLVDQPAKKSADETSAVPGLAPVTRFDHPVSAHRVIEAFGLPLHEIQQIRQKLPGVTLNDLFISVTGGALRQYLEGKHELPAKTLSAMVPMSIRGPNKDTDTGNQVSMTTMPICSNIANPIERLLEVHQGSSRSKKASESIGKDLPAKLLNLLPSMVGKLLVDKALTPRANLTISNVRGPEMPLYLAGAKMVLFLPVSIPMDNLGLNITGFSYNGTLWVCAVACRVMIPDPAHFAQCFRDSFEALLKAAIQLEIPTTSKRTVDRIKPVLKKVTTRTSGKRLLKTATVKTGKKSVGKGSN